MEMFYILTESVSILVVILNCSFARCYHGGKLGKEYKKNLSVFFLTTACEYRFIINKKFRKISLCSFRKHK